MMMYLLLLIGFVLLLKGADLFVEGSSSISKLLKIPSVIIGLTIVAMGTSAPEAAVSITAGLAGNCDIAISNVIGSNIFNLMVVIGICAIIHAVPSDKDILKRDLPFNLGITLMLFLLILDGKIGRLDGAILLIVFVSYLYIVIRSAIKNRAVIKEETDTLTPFKSIVFIVVGLVAVVLGGKWVVNSASQIAISLGMSQTLVGLTIVAVGTSLPELVTSIVAAKKGDSGLALGNVIGSNIFNILFILGLASGITPISVARESILDTGILIIITTIALLFCRSKKETSRGEGIAYLGIYVGYMLLALLR